jgi:hypothetical protein
VHQQDSTEENMKLPVTLLSAVLAGVVVCAVPLSGRLNAQDTSKESKSEAKETKIQGQVIRINKDLKTIDIRGGANTRAEDLRKVAYDDSTEWTKLGKPGKMEEVKENSFIIVVGHMQKDGTVHAKRIDLRLPR